MPQRILDRHVGGNTTYARHLASGLETNGHRIRRIRSAGNPLGTLAFEAMSSFKAPQPRSLLHFVADTGPLLRTRTPSIVTVHGVASRWIKTARSPRQEAVWRWRVAAALRASDRVLTVSNSSRSDIAEVFDVDPSRISVIPHGVDTAMFLGTPQLSTEEEQGIPSEFILYLGNIEPRKNLVALVEAVDQINSSGTSVQLVIAGRPAWNYEESMRVITDSPNVSHLGFVSDALKVALLQRCSLFVFPSLYEGFGFPVLEAMAAGSPVLTSDRGSLAEVSGPARTLTGTSRDDIAHGIENSLSDSAWLKGAGSIGQGWAQRFSWSQSVHKHIEAYEQVVGSR